MTDPQPRRYTDKPGALALLFNPDRRPVTYDAIVIDDLPTRTLTEINRYATEHNLNPDHVEIHGLYGEPTEMRWPAP
jgi:hypothetical protein